MSGQYHVTVKTPDGAHVFNDATKVSFKEDGRLVITQEGLHCFSEISVEHLVIVATALERLDEY